MKRYIYSAAIIAATVGYMTTADAKGELYPKLVKPSVKIVDHDGGGRVDQRIAEIDKLRAAGTQVRIRGNCWSACTLYLALESTCVYPSASLHFHAPYYVEDNKKVLANPVYQAWFLRQSPTKVQMRLAAAGGLGVDCLHVSGPRALPLIAPYCKD